MMISLSSPTRIDRYYFGLFKWFCLDLITLIYSTFPIDLPTFLLMLHDSLLTPVTEFEGNLPM